MKYLLIIADGMGDLPIPKLANKTPLEAAQTPNLDRMAKNGKTGLISVLGPGIRPNSDEAHLVLFGYDLKTDYPGRGPIEAAGVGVEPPDAGRPGHRGTAPAARVPQGSAYHDLRHPGSK